MKLEFSQQTLENCSNIKYQENPSSGSRVVPWGQTDRNDEANSPFSQFCERVLKMCEATQPILQNGVNSDDNFTFHNPPQKTT
jgi:hypothetical protein